MSYKENDELWKHYWNSAELWKHYKRPSMEDKPKDTNEPVKSTTEDVQIYHADDDDVLIVRIDAKHPARQKIFAGIQAALEGAQRNDEAIKAKAYAAEKLPDDWRRKKSEKPEERTIRHAEPHHYPAKAEK